MRDILVSGIEQSTAKNGKPFAKVDVINSDKTKTTYYLWDNISGFNDLLLLYKVFSINVEDGQYPKILSFEGKAVDNYDDFINFIYPNENYAYMVFDGLIHKVSEPVFVDLLSEIFNDQTTQQKFITWPAAKNYHHAYKYGLLHHSGELVTFIESICENNYYKESINKDLAITGAILHDIGKIFEYSFDGISNIEYAKELYVNSHLSKGAEMVSVAYSKLKENKQYSERDDALIEAVKHIIRSHHLRKDWDAIAEPKTKEAMLVTLADNFSAFFDKYKNAKFDGELGKLDREVLVDFLGGLE